MSEALKQHIQALEQKVDGLSQKLDNIQTILKAVSKITKKRVSFMVPKTDSDIQIVGGSTVVTKKGTLVGVSCFPVGAGQVASLMSVYGDDGIVYTIDTTAVKLIDD